MQRGCLPDSLRLDLSDPRARQVAEPIATVGPCVRERRIFHFIEDVPHTGCFSG